MTIKALYPIIKPSLLLDFANAGKLDPRAVFTRAGAATYFDDSTPPVLVTAPAGVARFDHAPVTGDKLGLLKEPQRANLLLRSEEFDDGVWTASGVSTAANAAVSPNGAVSAEKLIETATTASHQIRQPTTIAENTTVCASVYLKAGERSSALVGIATKTGGFRIRLFNLANGTNSQPTQAGYTTVPLAFGMDSVGNGWYRCWVADSVGTGSIITEHFRTFVYNGAVNYTGDGTSGLYIWGAQLEVGAFPTSYIKTEGSSVTRPADALSIAQGNAGQGTFLVDSTTRSGDTLITSGTTTFDATAATRQITAVAYDSTDTRRSINGAAVASSAGTTGDADVTIASGATGHISKVALYPQKLTDTNLQALTT